MVVERSYEMQDILCRFNVEVINNLLGSARMWYVVM